MSAPPLFRLVDERRVSVVRDAAACLQVFDDDPVGSCMVAARVAEFGVEPGRHRRGTVDQAGCQPSRCSYAGAQSDPVARGCRGSQGILGQGDEHRSSLFILVGRAEAGAADVAAPGVDAWSTAHDDPRAAAVDGAGLDAAVS